MVLNPCASKVREQLKLEKKEHLNKIVNQLGFKEEIDYDGKTVLKNNVFIKKKMSLEEVSNMLTRL